MHESSLIHSPDGQLQGQNARLWSISSNKLRGSVFVVDRDVSPCYTCVYIYYERATLQPVFQKTLKTIQPAAWINEGLLHSAFFFCYYSTKSGGMGLEGAKREGRAWVLAAVWYNGVINTRGGWLPSQQARINGPEAEANIKKRRLGRGLSSKGHVSFEFRHSLMWPDCEEQTAAGETILVSSLIGRQLLETNPSGCSPSSAK